MRKTFGALIALAAASLTLPGAASAQNKIVIGIPTSPPNIVHMPPIVAKELGLYKKAGIDAEIVSLGDGTKVFRALLAENIDFGLTPGAPTIIGRSNGATVKALSANLPKFEASMIVRAEIKTIGRFERQTHRHPGAWRVCRHFESRRIARRKDRPEGG